MTINRKSVAILLKQEASKSLQKSPVQMNPYTKLHLTGTQKLILVLLSVHVLTVSLAFVFHSWNYFSSSMTR